MRGLSYMGRSCLDIVFVRGYRRVPVPPARIIPFLFIKLQSGMSGFPQLLVGMSDKVLGYCQSLLARTAIGISNCIESRHIS